MSKFIKNYLGHAISVFVSVILAGVIGYFSAYINLIDRIHAVQNEANQSINDLNAAYTRISTNIEHIKKTLDERVVPKLNTVADHTADLRVIKDRLGRVTTYIDHLEDTEPERIRQDERDRMWKINSEEWHGETEDKLKNLRQFIEAISNP